MAEVFKTVLMLSLFGFAATLLLLCIKPLASKRLSAKWQYYTYFALILAMLVPVYRLIPQREAQRLSFGLSGTAPQSEAGFEEKKATPMPTALPEKGIQQGEALPSQQKTEVFEVLSYVWLGGMSIYLLVIFASYAAYLAKSRKGSVEITKNDIFDGVKKELKIKRRIRLKMSDTPQAPVLVGTIAPVVYIPCREISDEAMHMIFLHELTHYKRRDLAVKWLAVLANAVHWFNPLCYLLCASLNEACEVSCDMAVVEGISDTKRKIYMETILDLVEQEANLNV